MRKLIVDALTIETSQDTASELQVSWRGRSLERQPGKAIAPYLANAVAEAASAKLPLAMHFEELDYFNSATVMTIVQCLHSARAKGVRVSIVYDEGLEWQRLSFDPMQVFAADGMLELRPVRGGGQSS
jgi:hypothetical protein